jgi:hypothetical protein
MSRLLRFPDAVRHDPRVDAWLHQHAGELGAIAQRWFEAMRACGDDVRELLHDGHPTACVADAAFAYVNAFKAHVNVGFFRGAEMVGLYIACSWLLPGRKRVVPCSIQTLKRLRPEWFRQDLIALLDFLKQHRVKPLIARRFTPVEAGRRTNCSRREA